MQTLKSIIDRLEGDPYTILETQPLAEFATVKKNYRLMALKYHPDRNKDEEATEKFIKINKAYEFLEIEANRKLYANHIKAIKEEQQRIASMEEERRVLIERLKQKEEEKAKRQEEMAAELKRRRQFFDRKMQEEEEREALRRQIRQQMNSQEYYEQMGSLIVKWEKGLSFTSTMLEMAFSPFGEILKVKMEANRRKATVVLNSIEKAEQVAKEFRQPLVRVELLIDGERRMRLLGALKKQKASIDMSLSTENISRLKDIINRNSSLYLSRSASDL